MTGVFSVSTDKKLLQYSIAEPLSASLASRNPLHSSSRSFALLYFLGLCPFSGTVAVTFLPIADLG